MLHPGVTYRHCQQPGVVVCASCRLQGVPDDLFQDTRPRLTASHGLVTRGSDFGNVATSGGDALIRYTTKNDQEHLNNRLPSSVGVA